VALSEELSKFLVVRYFCYPQKRFDEPLDGIVYSVMVSMGFATIENMNYVFTHGYGTAFVRMFLSVPAHATFGVVMGFFIGKAKFDSAHSFKHLLTGLLIAVLFHGTFDFFIFLQANEAINGTSPTGYYLRERSFLLLSQSFLAENKSGSIESYQNNYLNQISMFEIKKATRMTYH
jgi:RsiW-degrading membrane proteinase PrsW (M82 family)